MASAEKPFEESTVAHIQDSRLRGLYLKIYPRTFQSLLDGEKLLKRKNIDRLAVLEAMGEAIRIILEDFEEHGNANLELWGNHRAPHFKEYGKKIARQIAQLKKNGAESSVFQKYREVRKKQGEKIAEETIAEMEASEALEKKLYDELKKAFEDCQPEKFIETWGKVKNIQMLAPATADALARLANNMLVFISNNGEKEQAWKLIRAYAQDSGKINPMLKPGADGMDMEQEIAGNALYFSRGNPELLKLISEKLVPKKITSARLAFNIACEYSAVGSMEEALKYIKLALELGKPKKQFLEDPDFENMKNEKEFQEMVGE